MSERGLVPAPVSGDGSILCVQAVSVGVSTHFGGVLQCGLVTCAHLLCHPLVYMFADHAPDLLFTDRQLAVRAYFALFLERCRHKRPDAGLGVVASRGGRKPKTTRPPWTVARTRPAGQAVLQLACSGQGW